MSNYKVVVDENRLREFITWLPGLEDSEAYFYALFARKKYAAEVRSAELIKRGTSSKELLCDKLKQLECEVGCYKSGNTSIPQEALATYINPNPRSFKKAARQSLKRLADLITRDNYNGWNPHNEVMSEVQAAHGRKLFLDFDFDLVSAEDTIENLKGCINLDCLWLLHTRGGFHLLVEPSKVIPKFSKTWYRSITSLKGCDVRGDNLMPIPGCYQGGFIPSLREVE